MTVQEGVNKTNHYFDTLSNIHKSMSDVITDTFIFTWQWWIGIALFIVPWIVWLLYRKKESTARLFLAGCTAIILSLIIEQFAIRYGLWTYPLKFLPAGPVLLLPYHFSVVPVVIMFTLQIFPNINNYLKGVIFSAMGAYAAMPLFEMSLFYNSKGWARTYDFFLYISIFLISYWSTKISGFDVITETNSDNRKR